MNLLEWLTGGRDTAWPTSLDECVESCEVYRIDTSSFGSCCVAAALSRPHDTLSLPAHLLVASLDKI